MVKPRVHQHWTAWGVALSALLGVACSSTEESDPSSGGTSGAAAEAGTGGSAGRAGSAAAGSGGRAAAGSDAGEGGTGGAAVGGAGGAGGAAVGGTGGSGGAGGAVAEPPIDEADGGVPTVVFDGFGEGAVQNGVLSASITMRDVLPGQESHECVIVELPNEEPVWVGELHGSLSGGSHHLIVERNSAATPVQNTAVTCPPTNAGDDTRLLIVQQRDTVLGLPEGVAYRLEAHQRIFLQLHFINTGNEPVQIVGKVELSPFAGEGTPKEALSIFAGPFQIAIPAGQETTVSHFQQPNPEGKAKRHVFALTSHTHKLGTRATIERVTSDANDAPVMELLHESLDWAEPPLTVFEKPLDFTTGVDGLRLTCQYKNTTNRTVSFGTSATDEMCFMWMYFYDE
ncbi:MAG: hypothetical protein ABW321_18190 [Polyangiales bacterium]